MNSAVAAPGAHVGLLAESAGDAEQDSRTSTIAFLKQVLPPTGLYVASRLTAKGFQNRVCRSIEELAQQVLQYDAQGDAAYYACAAYRAPYVDVVQADGSTKHQIRIQENVREVKDFWADLDVEPGNPKKFESQEAAIAGLVAFCSATGLPIPMVVASGWGAHIHWTLTEPIQPEAWKQTAEGLKALFTKLGFKADPACTADSARVLRPVGTRNRKIPNNARPVTLEWPADDIQYSVFNDKVQCALKSLGTTPPEVVRRDEVRAATINVDFAVKRDFPPCSGIKVAERCKQLAQMRDTKGCISEPHWFACIQLLCHTTEGGELIHQWSSGHENYSEAETNGKIEHLRSQAIGPTLCTTFADRNPGGCDGCAFKGKISSPVQLGAVMSEVPARAEPGRMPATADDFLAMDDATALALVMHAPTEDNVGRLFERQYIGKLRYCKAWGSWLSWDGTRWRPERTDLAFDFARTQARAANPSGKTTTARAAFARGVEAYARASRCFATESEQWDRNEFALNTPGGTVDLRTGEMRSHDQADFITKTTSVTPCAGPMPAFDRFMDEITCGDKSLIKYHQLSLGAMLSGARADHWLLFWIGSGRNGKNTLGDRIAEILGDYAKTIPTETLMSTRTQGHPTEIANLRGVRLAISSEVAEGAYWNETRIKSLTGDTTLSGRLMRGDFFEFPRAHKHLIYGNTRPQLRVVDDAIRARMHIVPFPATFNDDLGNRDPLMGEKLRAEAPQILAWLIEGHRQWVSNGFKLTPCDAVRRETQDYLDTQSTPALWIEEQCEIIENDTRSTNLLSRATELYTSYSEFKKLRSEQPMSMTRWGEWMGKRFTKVTSNGVRYRGIRLKLPGTEHYGTPFT